MLSEYALQDRIQSSGPSANAATSEQRFYGVQVDQTITTFTYACLICSGFGASFIFREDIYSFAPISMFNAEIESF